MNLLMMRYGLLSMMYLNLQSEKSGNDQIIIIFMKGRINFFTFLLT